MNGIRIGFEHPWYLLALLLLPVIWWMSYQTLSSLGPVRRWIALTLRSLVVLLIVAALAGIQWIWTSEKVTVIYLLDQSDSIPRAKREVMLNYVIDAVRKHRRKERDDRAGLIVFGREAAIEIPPFDDDLPQLRSVESYFGQTDATNLESALKLAQASFPEDSARRVVIVTDGVETMGTALPVVQSMAETGVGVDVVPVTLDSGAEVLLEKIELPSKIRQGQPIEARVVIQRYQEKGKEKPVRGKLHVWRKLGAQQEVLVDETVELDRDLNVFPFQHTIDQPAGYTYEAEFSPDDLAQDSLTQNNRATAFAYVRGKGRVLLVENWRNVGEYDSLVQALRRSQIEVEIQPSNQLFTSLAELQAFDCVILAGVAKSSGEDASEISEITDEQVQMLVRNTEQFGAGLLMIGGPEAFGAGGWANTDLEKAMPVDFQIKNKKVEAVGALAMILHASEIPEGNYWQKQIAKASIDVLGPMDYCGILHFDGMNNNSWLWNNGLSRVGENRATMRNRLSRMTPADMPDFAPTMQMGLAGLQQTKASIKHMIIISDGDPEPPPPALINQYATAGIKVSTVAVGAHGPAGHQVMQNIANITGGNYYVVNNPRALPKIFVREAMRVSKPLVFEPEGGVQPSVAFPHEALQGIQGDLPNLRGFVLTTLKESPLVEVAIRSPRPSEVENQTILATWTYGLGRTAVYTSDAGKRWASNWQSWAEYDRFWSQLVRWTMRPSDDNGKYTVATQIRDGRVQVVVNAIDNEDRFLNFLDLTAVGVGPDMKPFTIPMRQQAPGRYVGQFDALSAGSYMLNISPGPGQAPLTTGVTVPFSDEYRIRQANFGLLRQIASSKPNGGEAGVISNPLDENSLKETLSNDSYRGGLPPAISLKDIWPWFVLVGSVLFFGDVLVRRVAIDLVTPFKRLSKRFRTVERSEDIARKESLERLRSRKSQVSDQLDEQRAAVRFEADPNAGAAEDLISGEAKATSSTIPRDTTQPKLSATEEADSYTSRLLAAKRKARKQDE